MASYNVFLVLGGGKEEGSVKLHKGWGCMALHGRGTRRKRALSSNHRRGIRASGQWLTHRWWSHSRAHNVCRDHAMHGHSHGGHAGSNDGGHGEILH